MRPIPEGLPRDERAVGGAQTYRQHAVCLGGSTSVGNNAIQLAVAAGYDEITTASPHNFDYVKRLGALEAYDYNSKTAQALFNRALSA